MPDVLAETFEVPSATQPEESPSDRQAVLVGMIEETKLHYEAEIEPEQKKATEYYMGRPFGNEESGRSQVVSTDVRDTVQSYLAQLTRIYWGPDRQVEFRPRGPEDIAAAEQATDYINYIIQEDNEGFSILHSVFKDALVRKLGIVKWWWETSDREETAKYSGLTFPELASLKRDPELTVRITSRKKEVVEVEGQPTEPRTSQLVHRAFTASSSSCGIVSAR